MRAAAPERTPSSTLDGAALEERMRTLFRNPRYRPPPVPVVAVEILKLTSMPDVPLRRVATLLQQDPMLAAQALRIARSAAYGGRYPINSIHDAVMRLGLKILRDVVMEAALNLRVFRSPVYGDAMERIRRHSVVTAHAARAICQYTEVDGEHAFLCGLLHDIGFATLLLALGEAPDRPRLDDLWPALDRVHPEAGAHLAELWRLPEPIGEILRRHHPEHAPPGRGSTPQVLWVVIAAEDLAREFGVSPRRGPPDDPVDAHDEATRVEAFRRVGLVDEVLELVRSELRSVVPAVG